MGYLLAYELCDYDASICPYMMADQLSMFFEMQGAMVGLIFLASNYYIWLSMKRIEEWNNRMTIFAPMVMVALPFVMTWAWTMFPVPDPLSLAILVPLALLPVVLGRFIPWTVSRSDRHQGRVLDGCSRGCHLVDAPWLRTHWGQAGGRFGAAFGLELSPSCRRRIPRPSR